MHRLGQQTKCNYIDKKLYEDNKVLYASVEQIPDDLARTAMQRVIQILKYHRDIYYDKFADGNKTKPKSAIINTIVASISSSVSANLSVFELLTHVLTELALYGERQTLT